VLKKALTRVLEDGDDSYEFVQARIDTINDVVTDEYNVARYLDAFNKKLNLYWFVLMKMFVQQFY
jgi:hypothetical protein